MSFALYPEGGLPRIWRFVAPGVLPADVLCRLDKEHNILLIDKAKFDQVSVSDRHRALRTQSSEVYVK